LAWDGAVMMPLQASNIFFLPKPVDFVSNDQLLWQ
jgi:hypothetical protein